MNTLKVNTGDWIVVCDGRKALILENIGNGVRLKLQTRESREHKTPATAEMGTERPGRVHESAGVSRSSVAQTDWHDLAEQEFLVSLAQRLDEAVTGGQTKAITVVAAPRALGMLREAYSPALRKAIGAEIARDYVNMPVPEIERLLMEA